MWLPQPKTLSDTGLGRELLQELVLRHLLDGGVQPLASLTCRLCLRGSIVEPLLQELKSLQLVEIRAGGQGDDALRYALTQRGQREAQDVASRDGYTGPAPIALKDYCQLVKAQAVGEQSITRDRLQAAMDGVVIDGELINTLGPALNSRRPLLVYGHAGTGKTFMCRRFNRIFGDHVYVPYAIAVQNTIISLFDPQYHWPIHPGGEPEAGVDARYVACQRPLVMVGGELRLDMLEVRFDRRSRQYSVPLQLKANNGVFLIDDLGRQSFSVDALFNRWIVPMEEQRDFLSLSNGQHFDIPFEQILVFSTNLDPERIADEAFLRRLGYKIHLKSLPKEHYRQVWNMMLEKLRLISDEGLFEFMVEELHMKSGKPLLACYPRDILGIARDIMSFHNRGDAVLNREILKKAWGMYCVH